MADLTERLAVTDRILKTLEDEMADIEALPAALLRQAFSGGL